MITPHHGFRRLLNNIRGMMKSTTIRMTLYLRKLM